MTMELWTGIGLGVIHFALCGVVIWMAMSGGIARDIKKARAKRKRNKLTD